MAGIFFKVEAKPIFINRKTKNYFFDVLTNSPHILIGKWFLKAFEGNFDFNWKNANN